VTWEEIQRADPDVLLLASCGFGVERTLREAASLTGKPEWEGLRAVREGRVYVADANTYFSRPGPRIVDSLEMLADMLHPEAGVVAPRSLALARVKPPAHAAA
jgi:iron complex transport system substrate-binding protein